MNFPKQFFFFQKPTQVRKVSPKFKKKFALINESKNLQKKNMKWENSFIFDIYNTLYFTFPKINQGVLDKRKRKIISTIIYRTSYAYIYIFQYIWKNIKKINHDISDVHLRFPVYLTYTWDLNKEVIYFQLEI